jgi:curved DNA-binding protein CbpA
LLALNLSFPCSADDVLAAYRGKVKSIHPDTGGDRKAFLVLQRHFEQAIAFVEE